MSTGTCYLQFYIEYILALQRKHSEKGILPELCIMTSGDTNDATVKLLKENNYFGMLEEQVTIVQQGQGVPALTDNDATLALDENSNTIVTKPHGHGDIHELLYRHGVAKKWFEKGLKWLVLFQDTNGIGMHSLPAMLGVSKKYDLIMNMLAVPRKAKQAIGAITKLEKPSTGEVRTINVEYNMLDPLLRATVSKEGDVNDDTGFSPYPGNINQILFKLDDYTAALDKSKGLMPEFVNPKCKYLDNDVGFQIPDNFCY
jgi:UDP-sugar pyrophosphorylase